ncbi:hypothetical protein BgiBS90_002330, partial [Biomphalaria glabrata]
LKKLSLTKKLLTADKRQQNFTHVATLNNSDYYNTEVLQTFRSLGPSTYVTRTLDVWHERAYLRALRLIDDVVESINQAVDTT